MRARIALSCIVLVRCFPLRYSVLMHLTLKLISHLSYAVLGGMLVYHGLKRSSTFRSLPMRWRGAPAVPIARTHRVILVSLGLSLVVVSVLLAFGVVQ
jgi:hypothetical protein